MARRLTVLAGFIVLGLTATLAGTVSPAYALAPNPVTVTTNWGAVRDVLEVDATPGTAPSGITIPRTIPQTTWINRARQYSGAIPKYKVVGTVGLGLTAVSIGWKIGRIIDTKWLHITADEGYQDGFGGTACSPTAVKWQYSASAVVLSGVTLQPADSWALLVTGSCASAGSNMQQTTEQHLPACSGNGATNGPSLGQYFTNFAAAHSNSHLVTGTFTGSGCDTRALYMTNSEMEAMLKTPDPIRDWVTGQDVPSSGWTTNSWDPQAHDPGQSGADATTTRSLLTTDPEVGLEIGKIIDPEWGEEADPTYDPNLISLPQPQLEETYIAYRARLRDAGFLGTITETEGSLDTDFNPSEVQRLDITRPDGLVRTGSPVLLGDPWPDPAPRYNPHDDIEITYNPTDAPPRDVGDPEPTGLAPPGSGGGSCDCPALDFSPLSDLDAGDVFPFGVFVYAADILDQFDADPEAPSWAFAMPDLDGHEIPDFEIDLDFFSDYMATIRTIISVVLWIGAVWWFATRLLGINMGDNPAEAASDDL